MNPKLAADAYNKISEGYALLALAIEQPGAGASVPPRSAPAPVDDLPPLSDDDYPDAPVAQPVKVNSALGACPVHRKAWTVKAGGISKNGKPYPAFWKCSERTDGVYCDQKPTKGWADSHPIPLEVVA